MQDILLRSAIEAGTRRHSRAIERARGRVEAQALEDHEPVALHEPSTAEKLLTNLNLRLLDTDDIGSRQNILQTIYDTEQQINPSFKPDHFSTEPVDLSVLQRCRGKYWGVGFGKISGHRRMLATAAAKQ